MKLRKCVETAVIQLLSWSTEVKDLSQKSKLLIYWSMLTLTWLWTLVYDQKNRILITSDWKVSSAEQLDASLEIEGGASEELREESVYYIQRQQLKWLVNLLLTALSRLPRVKLQSCLSGRRPNLWYPGRIVSLGWPESPLRLGGSRGSFSGQSNFYCDLQPSF